ncbi:MAG: hypothetical protein KJ970_02420 [Candidatus Eisenbacteria bacterium]|uniref:Uncharacterized protein n=1 Tax=Eiseniibacteriota bacterium TaxID=2212470 RepID=A0A948WB91_UNCEI|nr:hypothetical protein [Candidatus Eisenbacteria bacterium]MBU2689753.1 hypothetical protein [Candidatus Eisenbacteria bacterium]
MKPNRYVVFGLSLVLAGLILGSHLALAKGDEGNVNGRWGGERTSSQGIKSVSLNRDGWIIVAGYGAVQGDKVYVKVGRSREVPIGVCPCGEGGRFEVLSPSLQLLVSLDKFFPVRIVIGPPSWRDISTQASERFVWEGRISVRNGVDPD